MFCFLQITCLIYVIGSCDLVRRCIGPQGLIIFKNLKNEKNQDRRFCTLALDEIGVISPLCIFSYCHRIFEINQHKYTTNSNFICTFNVFRSNHLICIFQNFLDPGKGACPPPRPSPRSGAIRSLA